MQFADRMKYFGTGIFSVLAEKKKQLAISGTKIVDFSIGAPNIPPAQHIIDALIEAAADPQNYVYAISDTPELKQAVAGWYQRRYNVDLDPSTEIVSLLGSQEGLAHISLSIVNPNDLVLVPDPGYPIFCNGPLLAGAQLYPMEQREDKGYIIDFNDIPDDIAEKARFMIVSYPNNPVTSLAPDIFYKELILFAKKHNIIVLHDNAYSELVFDGVTGGSFLSFPGAKDVGIEFNSLSKTYGLAGARIGFAVGNAEVIQNLANLKSNLDYGMFLPIQKAAIAAITGPQDCVATTCAAYQHRRDLLIDGLNAIGWKIKKSQATMFVWAKIPPAYKSSEEFVIDLMEKAGVIVVPGTAFGALGEGHVRMALVQDDEDILYAINAIDKCGILRQ